MVPDDASPDAMVASSDSGVLEERVVLAPLIEAIAPSRDYGWAFTQFKPSLLQCARYLQKPSVLEIGGGRSPLFDREESARSFSDYTVNDISQDELDRAPDYVHKICFDISGDAPDGQTYDLVFSKTVFEHIEDASQAYKNVHKLLKPGGIALNLIPTLMCPPFVLNRLLPETLSRRILAFFFPARNDEEIPKFRAYYKWCYSTTRCEKRIGDVGFSEVRTVPFYGHAYFKGIPIVRQADNALSRFAKTKDIRLFSSYAYIVAQK